MNNFRISKKSKSILITIGMVLLIFALLTGVSYLMNNKKNPTLDEGYEPYKVTWKSGGISSTDGSIVLNKGYMYSSAIKCDTTLRIEREFDSRVSYKVYYYNELGELLFKDESSTTTNYTKVISDIDLVDGQVIDHARIVVEWLEDDNDELSAYERFKLSNKIDVYVLEAEDVVEEENTEE